MDSGERGSHKAGGDIQVVLPNTFKPRGGSCIRWEGGKRWCEGVKVGKGGLKGGMRNEE